MTSCNCGEGTIKRRQASSTTPLSTPSPLTTFQPSILSSACSRQVTPVNSTSTVVTTRTQQVNQTFTNTTPSSTYSSVNVTITTTTQNSTATITSMTTTTTTAFVTYTSTTTIVLPSGAPSGNLTYLAISRAVNLGATYALSDLGTHMTDNYYTPTKREIFVLSSAGRLFSVTNDAYYYPQVGGTMLFCF